MERRRSIKTPKRQDLSMPILIAVALLFVAACGGAVAEPAEEPALVPSIGPVEFALCRAVDRCTDYGWIHRNAEVTCGAGDAFDRTLSSEEARRWATEIEGDLCRYSAPPVLIRFWCGGLEGAEVIACVKPLCSVVDEIGTARCMDPRAPAPS